MNKEQLKHLKMLAETDFDKAVVWAEQNITSLSDYFETWASNCGAPRDVFIGHTIAMLIRLD